MIKLDYPKFWQRCSPLSWFLLPLSAIYFILGKLRHLTATPRRLPAKVICIGNATVGGTGKTQVAIWLVKKLRDKGLKLVILCKGYGGSFKSPIIVDISMDSRVVGDEALELCEYAPTIVARKPTDAMALLSGLSPDVIIVDDGMQNPNFIKDFIIMVVDGARGFGNRMLFPAGPMRQSVSSSLEIANVVVVTDLASSLRENNEIIGLGSAYKATILPQSLRDSRLRGDDTEVAVRPYTELASAQKYYAFTGIGNPQRFFELCKSCGDLVATKAFPDHHKYSEVEITEMRQAASKLGAKLITTRKDYVKLRSYKDIISLNVTLEIEGGDKLLALIFQ